nr:MAG: hypothetical protein [Betatorquevirus sp.]
MSIFWKPTPFGPRERENQWINYCIQGHDQICGCDSPGDHLLYCLAERSGKLNISKNILEESTKCLTTHAGDDAATGEQDAIDLLDGDLEKLFEEDIADPTTG